MKICFHGNQLSGGINYPLISVWSKYRSPSFIHLSAMLAPVISSLDEIYCIIIFFCNTCMHAIIGFDQLIPRQILFTHGWLPVAEIMAPKKMHSAHPSSGRRLVHWFWISKRKPQQIRPVTAVEITVPVIVWKHRDKGENEVRWVLLPSPKLLIFKEHSFPLQTFNLNKLYWSA